MNKILLALTLLGTGGGAFLAVRQSTTALRCEANASREAWLLQTQLVAVAQTDQAALIERVRQLGPMFFRFRAHVHRQQTFAKRSWSRDALVARISGPGAGRLHCFVQRFVPGVPKIFRGPISDTRNQFHHSFECDLVARVRYASDKSRDIFDVGLFEKANATGDLIGNTAARELEL